MAVSSLPAVGFGICAPFSASSSTQPSKERPTSAERALYVVVHPDGPHHKAGCPHFSGSPECLRGTVSRRPTDGISPRLPFAWPSPKNALFIAAANSDHTSDHSDGIEFPDIGAVQLEAIKSTGEILRDLNYPIEVGSEWRMEVADEARKPLFSLRVITEFHE